MSEKETVLVLRTCDAKMQGYGGFQWPDAGDVECPDFSDKKQCGQGLHGWLWGAGDWSLKSRGEGIWWLVVEVEKKSIVDLGDKVKFPRGKVIAKCPKWTEAMAIITERAKKVFKDVAVATKRKEIASATGDSGHASATGDYGHASATGYSGHASATGYYGWATSGYFGKAKAGKDGVISILWWDERKERPRLAVGYVGEEGIEADALYKVIGGKLKKVVE